MVTMTSTISAIVIHSFILVLALETVKAYVPYEPTSNDADYDNVVDVQPYQRSSDANIFSRYLNSLLLDSLAKIDRRVPGGYDSYKPFKASKRVPIDEERRNYLQKRKIFWQPLGYLPAGVHPNGNQGGAQGGGSNGRQVFRYGK